MKPPLGFNLDFHVLYLSRADFARRDAGIKHTDRQIIVD